MKNLIKFENFGTNENSSYDKMYKLILEYIKKTLSSKIEINKHVDNTHIAETFKEVLIYLELENMYPNEFHVEHKHTGWQFTEEKGTEYITSTSKSDFHILKWLESGDYFNKELLKSNGEEEIHRVYQKLREKNDLVENTIKLVRIKLDDYVQKHLVNKDLNAHNVKIVKKRK